MPIDFAAVTPVTFTVKVTDEPAYIVDVLGVIVTVPVCAAATERVEVSITMRTRERKNIFFIVCLL